MEVRGEKRRKAGSGNVEACIRKGGRGSLSAEGKVKKRTLVFCGNRGGEKRGKTAAHYEKEGSGKKEGGNMEMFRGFLKVIPLN